MGKEGIEIMYRGSQYGRRNKKKVRKTRKI
jgi:hypothetical protein